MVYTRWKCDRLYMYTIKYFTHEYPINAGISIATMTFVWKHLAYCSEETERRHGWWTGYPHWRDPIARRNEDKYKRLIRDNDIDIADPKWTGVSKEVLATL